jgi:hypothetical protein
VPKPLLILARAALGSSAAEPAGRGSCCVKLGAVKKSSPQHGPPRDQSDRRHNAQIRDAVAHESSVEIDPTIRGIRSTFEPYERFYANESEKIERLATLVQAVENEARDISSSVAQL